MGAAVRSLDASDPGHFREALSRFASGVVVVTGSDAGEPVGMTCQSFSSLSLEPPLVLFCAASTSTTFPRLRRARNVCVNVLSQGQAGLASQFARSGTEKWAGVEHSTGPGGAPRIDGAAMWCEGQVVAVHGGGDHVIVVVRVDDLATTDAPSQPLIFHEGSFTSLVPVQVDA